MSLRSQFKYSTSDFTGISESSSIKKARLSKMLSDFEIPVKSSVSYLNYYITSPKSHSTDTLTALLDLLNSAIAGVNCCALKGDCRCILSGYAGSPYRDNGFPSVEKEWFSNRFNKPDLANIPASCLFPSKNNIINIKTNKRQTGKVLFTNAITLLIEKKTHKL
jgi:hypothetical protein